MALWDRQSGKDIGVTAKGATSDGTTLWFLNGGRFARAYSVSNRSRDSDKDFDLNAISTSGWESAVTDGTTIWFVNDSNQLSASIRYRAWAYRLSDMERDSTKDISLGTGQWLFSFTDRTTLWFGPRIGGSARTGERVAWNINPLRRDSDKDSTLITGVLFTGAVLVGDTIFFVNNALNNEGIIAFYISGPNAGRRNRNRETLFRSTNNFEGLVHADNTFWVGNTTTGRAMAFEGILPTATGSGELNIGSTEHTKTYIGSQEYTKVYVGSQLFWQRG